ncbi:MAG: aminopeptidase N [Paracoccaceae bacterium]
MRTDTGPTPSPTRLADYTPPPWLVETVRLVFRLDPGATRVRATLSVRRNPDGPAATGARPAFRLDGRQLALLSATIDGTEVSPETDPEGLTVPADRLPGDAFTWEAETEIAPEANTALEGLYFTKGMYCTQCEAEGFRKITYYPDRPDVMARFSVRIEAPDDIPVLLSNGNPGERGALTAGGHFAEWDDPWPKPAYLFALVAGRLFAHEDRFVTRSGRDVALKIWVRPGDEAKCAYAMDALIRSMRWDEETHGREYDLDLFQIVAVDDFNMGAMENKGLNIFNSAYVLASPETATDRDYELIEGIVAHEYFHNWTGNRITCRDWFQLCLKEGLTVFRDQCFTGDMRSEPVQRIGDVLALRARQFPEDQGPLAHPVRPEEYIEINNFYTATVYEKGAEVIRMLRTLLGEETYRRGLDLYFARHDGEATTIEAFRACFEEVSGRDLSQFALWWSQAGTPRIKVSEDWDGKTYRLTLAQATPPTPGQAEKRPLLIPFAIGLLAEDGRELAPTRIVELDGWETTLEFPLPERPVPSLNRGFSAPVVIERRTSSEERAVLSAHDPDPFNRWEAGYRAAVEIAIARILHGEAIRADWVAGVGRLLSDDGLDPAFRAFALELPSEATLARETAEAGQPADPNAVFAVRREMEGALADGLAGELIRIYETLETREAYNPGAEQAGKRALRNRALWLLAVGGSAGVAQAETHYDTADNMTDAMAALGALVRLDTDGAAPRLHAFYDRWQSDANAIDTWFSIQATAPGVRAVDRVEALTGHPAFAWRTPNRFRSLVGAFAMGNPTGFHARDGAGYRFVTDWLLRLDAVNPQTAARLATAFESWRIYTEDRQELMRAELQRMAATEMLSKNCREMVERMLGPRDPS